MDDLPLLNWRPPVKVVLFPSIRRRAMIQRTATAAAASKNPENTIRATIERARASHSRKGVEPERSEQDLQDLENALRTQITLILSRLGVAR
jgi:hypothetical protein